MKKTAFGLLAGLLTLASCVKNNNNYCSNVQPAAEMEDIKAFCISNGMAYQVDDTTGIFYQVTTLGNGEKPTNNNDTLQLAVVTKLLNGTQIQRNDSVMVLAQDVPALLMFGVTKISEFGALRMVSPSAYAYGCQGAKDNSGTQVVPPNSPLYYEIKLVDLRRYK